MIPILTVAAMWVAWVVSWMGAAFWADPIAKRPSAREELFYRVATIGGAALLAVGDRLLHIGGHWDLGRVAGWVLVAIVALSLVFVWWARLYLGRLWSSSVTKKAAHHVVDTGPYAIVRHPIYTGLIVAIFATAVLKAGAAAIIGAVLMTLGFWLKARLEERFLRAQLGADAYDSYRRKVPMLVPFWPKSA